MKVAVEKVILLYGGAKPNSAEIRDIARIVDQLGFDTAHIVISAHSSGDAAPQEDVAPFILLRLADEGKLSPNPLERATIHTIGEGANQAILVIVAREGGPRRAPSLRFDTD